MTLKEKVAKHTPYRIDGSYKGGVYGCPNDYKYLNDTTDNDNCGNKRITDEICAACWNREYKEDTDAV